MTPTADEQAGMDWLDERLRARAAELALDLQEHRWGQDPKHFDRGEFALAMRVRAMSKTRRILVFDGDDLADCGKDDAGKRAAAEVKVRAALREMASIAKATPPKPKAN